MKSLPLTTVKNLYLQDGQFWLSIECWKCGRDTELCAATLAECFREESRVLDAVKRLVCETCRANELTVVSG
jgi:hypothetical protein